MNREAFELLAPAGDLEKLKTAVIYGADAVYFGGEMFSLRAGAGNLTVDEMKEGTALCPQTGKALLSDRQHLRPQRGHPAADGVSAKDPGSGY